MSEKQQDDSKMKQFERTKEEMKDQLLNIIYNMSLLTGVKLSYINAVSKKKKKRIEEYIQRLHLQL